jgi:demethylmenaquinone methyltransferase/2-methoxy-6-polyprenyl-1,4-benzoquinol methylase
LNIIPKIGKIVADDENSYRYLAESIQTYFSPNEIKDMLSKAGFDNTKVINLLEDVATIHIGQKL